MPYIPLAFPPGMVRPGTVYDARGRWYDGNLVRWYGGGERPALQPVGGWSALSGAGSVATGGYPIRGMHAWRLDSSPYVRLAFGSTNEFYTWNGGTLTSLWSHPNPGGNEDSSGDDLQDQATTWQIDNFGEDLVFTASSNGQLQYYDASAGTVSRIQSSSQTDAPDFALAVVVTPERFVMALAADSDNRKIQWCDQEDPLSAWTPTTSNQAGSFTIQTRGAILAGRAARGETLIWTDVDLWAVRYVGGDLIYGFQRLGNQCGAISRLSMAVIDGKAAWMGENNFYLYDGYVQAIPCEVADFVFNDLNRAQRHKVAADVRADFHEVWWYYPSSGSDENDRYVAWNWQYGFWMIGSIERTSGVDRGIFANPIAADASGCLYEHETGTAYADEGGSPSYEPYAESGPIEIGNGDNVMMIRQFIPDEESLGEVDLRLYTRFYPTSTETTNGPYTLANPTDVRLTARQVRMRVEQVTAGWRVGTPRLEVVPGGLR